jgi:hypothetical protein
MAAFASPTPVRSTASFLTRSGHVSPSPAYFRGRGFTFPFCERPITGHIDFLQLLSEGAGPAWVARMMGHSNTRMIALKYWRYIRHRSRPAGKGYLEVLGRACGGMHGESRP